jgi:hypothetical protein
MNYEYEKHVLIGKTVTSVELAKDKMALKFNVAESDSIVATTDGDCCSHTWIEHVELPALGFPAKVFAVESIEFAGHLIFGRLDAGLDLPDVDDSPDESERVVVYGLKIVTDKGEFIIDFRNSSNGYYGGWMNWPEDDTWVYGGVFGQNVSSLDWEPLTEDV